MFYQNSALQRNNENRKEPHKLTVISYNYLVKIAATIILIHTRMLNRMKNKPEIKIQYHKPSQTMMSELMDKITWSRKALVIR